MPKLGATRVYRFWDWWNRHLACSIGEGSDVLLFVFAQNREPVELQYAPTASRCDSYFFIKM